MTDMKGSRSVAVLVLVLLLAVGAGGAAFANTIYVPSQYATIQGAINVATNGDVVVVAAGTYKENITISGKAITVRSTAPTNPAVVAATIINGEKKGNTVEFDNETAKAVLSGFTITGGNGGGVHCWYFSPTLTYNIIRGNSGRGGVYCDGSSPTLTNNIISGNSATGSNDGGGVSCSTATLTNNTITGNSASSGGGVYCSNGTLTLTNNIISGNRATEYGGGVCCPWYSPSKLTNNTITGNSATSGGGVYCSTTSPSKLTNNIISGNSATNGGGVYCSGSSAPTLTNDTISGNSATGLPMAGGGVWCEPSSPPIIKNTIIAFNTKGGGIYNGGSGSTVLVVTYSDFYGNTGGNYVGLPDPTGQNGNISKNPLFEDAAAGNVHLKSKYGRWAPATKTWVIDTVTSPCIDAGDPKSAHNLEPAPNGGRINMGAYGDTIYASKSATTGTSSAAALTVSAASAQGLAGGRQQLVFVLSAPASVQAEIVNLAGRVIRELPAGETSPAGVNTLSWDGLSAAGTAVPNGVYLVRLVARTPDGAQAQAVVTCTVRR
jgi:parallel beta-helix repeat protein